METNATVKLPVFADRFRELREIENLSQANFADFVGISRPTVGFYENGDRLPDALVIKKICEKCRVSADWLIGLSDVKSPDIEMKAICKKTGLSERSVVTLMCEADNSAFSRPVASLMDMIIESEHGKELYDRVFDAMLIHDFPPKETIRHSPNTAISDQEFISEIKSSAFNQFGCPVGIVFGNEFVEFLVQKAVATFSNIVRDLVNHKGGITHGEHPQD